MSIRWMGIITTEKGVAHFESWHYSCTSSRIRGPMTSISQFGSTRIKTEARLVLAGAQSIREHARVRWHAHVLTASRRTGAYWPRGIRTYKPSRVLPIISGPERNERRAAGAFFRPSRTANACAACACMDKQRFQSWVPVTRPR